MTRSPSRRNRREPRAEAARRPPKRDATPGSFEIPAVLLVLLAAVILNAGSLRLPFFSDDFLFLDAIRGRSLLSTALSGDPIGNYWRPVGRQLYFWLIAALGESPVVAHGLNLLMFAAVLVVFHLLVRRIAGLRPAIVATALVAVHHAADVPVRWVSGSQDLIAVLGAIASLYLLVLGQRGWAACALAVGLLGKETVLLTPLVGAWLVHRRGRPFRHTLLHVWPLVVPVAIWVIVQGIVRPAWTAGVESPVSALPAAIVHLLQALVGAEWSPHRPFGTLGTTTFGLALVTIVLAVVIGWRGRRVPDPDAAPGGALLGAGITWGVVGAIPVATVVGVWSAYHYLFAMCGLALVVGSLLQRRSLVVVLAVVVACAWSWERARRLDTFATKPDPWSTQSHINAHYIERSMIWNSRLLGQLRDLHPSLPPHSTLFFSGIPAFVGLQTADGPVIRWAYRDSTLRSYYLSDWTRERAERGPMFVFAARGATLREIPAGAERFRYVAITQALSDHHLVARDAAVLGRARHPEDPALAYWAPWFSLALGDSVTAYEELRAAGFDTTHVPYTRIDAVKRTLEEGDSTAAITMLVDVVRRHVLDPDVHALLADVLSDPQHASGRTMEALIVRLLEPENPLAWRRWAEVQLVGQHPQQARVSLDRYFQLAGPEGPSDATATRLDRQLEQLGAGGALVQQAVHGIPSLDR